MGIEEGYYTCDIDLSVIDETRQKLPFLEGLRFDVVQRDGG